MKKALSKKRKKASEESDGSPGDSSSGGDEDDEDAGEGSGWQAKRKRFKRIAEREPGRLVVEALESMQEQLGAHYGDEFEAGGKLQPMVTRYLLGGGANYGGPAHSSALHA